MGRTAIALAVGLTVAALTVAGCGRDASGRDAGAVDVVATTDVWGSVASAVAGEHARQVDPRQARPKTRTRMRRRPPTPPRSPMRRWWSTTGATTTTGSTTCWPAPGVGRRRLLAAPARRARQRTRLLRPSHRQGRRRRRSPSDSPRSTPRTPTNIAPTQRNSAVRPTTSRHRSGRSARPTRRVRLSRPNRLRTTCCAMPGSPTAPRRVSPAPSRRAMTRRPPTSPRCST